MTSGAKILAKTLCFVLLATVPSGLLMWTLFGQSASRATAPAGGAALPTPVLVTAPRPAQGSALPPGHPAILGPATRPGASPAGGSVTVDVSYAGNAATLPQSAAILVFVRAPGQRMPLAVERFSASDLPRAVTLNVPEDPGSSLEVVARLSRDGDVRLDPDDRERVGYLPAGNRWNEALTLEIPDAP